MEGLGSGVIK